MKRITLTIIICLVSIVCHAQDHLQFMDIPLNCTLDDFCSKLIKDKGLSSTTITDGEQFFNMETRKLYGKFFGIKDCTFFVRKHERLDHISSVIVEDTISALSKADEARIISLLDKYHGNHEIDSTYSFTWYTWKAIGGDVELSINKNGFRIYYIDSSKKDINKKISEEFQRERERQTTKEICGIPFGSSYEMTEEVLENKYGRKDFISDRTRIIYTNKTYAGITFDRIIFLFQSDGYKSYLNGCVFILEAPSMSKAKEEQDMLYSTLLSKYKIWESVDNNGKKFYYGEHSPVPFGGFGFIIDIIEYDNSPSTPYAARLMYGRYNYVKEEF